VFLPPTSGSLTDRLSITADNIWCDVTIETLKLLALDFKSCHSGMRHLAQPNHIPIVVMDSGLVVSLRPQMCNCTSGNDEVDDLTHATLIGLTAILMWSLLGADGGDGQNPGVSNWRR